MHELGRLIASVQERNGWSDRDLQLRAEQLGLTALSKSNFSRWRNSPVNSIKGSNIRDMAAVLGVAEATVATAALESMGIRSGGDTGASVDTALSLDPDLSARDKMLVRALLGAMSAAEERDGSGSAAPMKTAGGDPAGEQQDQTTPTASAAPVVGEQEVSSAGAAGGQDGVDGGELTAEFFYGLAADDRRTEGMAFRDAIDAAGEESQVPGDEDAEA